MCELSRLIYPVGCANYMADVTIASSVIYHAAGYLCYCSIREQLWTQQRCLVALSSISSSVVGSWICQFQLWYPIHNSSLIIHCCHHVSFNWLEWVRLCEGLWNFVLTRTAVDGLQKTYKDGRFLPVYRNIIISSSINKPIESPLDIAHHQHGRRTGAKGYDDWAASAMQRSNEIQTSLQSIPMQGKLTLRPIFKATTPWAMVSVDTDTVLFMQWDTDNSYLLNRLSNRRPPDVW